MAYYIMFMAPQNEKTVTYKLPQAWGPLGSRVQPLRFPRQLSFRKAVSSRPVLREHLYLISCIHTLYSLASSA